MRQKYETESDRCNETDVAGRVAEIGGWGFTKLSPALYGVDWAFWRKGSEISGCQGPLVLLAEVKCRKIPHDRFSHYMVSEAKMWKLRDIAARGVASRGVASRLIVRFTDGLYAAKAETEYTRGIGTRNPPRDQYDTEPMAFIPMSGFAQIPG